jgi:hypothetical protein
MPWFGIKFSRRGARAEQKDDESEGSITNKFIKKINSLNENISEDPDDYSGCLRWYLILCKSSKMVCESEWFNYTILGVIIVAGINIGLQTYPQLSSMPLFEILDSVILTVFSMEALLKILSEGLRPFIYFTG